MKNKIKKMLKLNCMNSFISIIALTIFFYGQSYAQWERTNLPDSVKINTLAISDSSIYAGTDGDGIFLSTDNGENWARINNRLSNKVVHTVFINGKTIFAGTDSGASISTNNGLSWNTINSGLSGLGVWSFAVSNFFGDTTIFAGTWSGVYSSTDKGKNWEVTGLPYTTMPVHSIIVHNNFIVAATLGGGVFGSQSSGLIWDDISITYTDTVTGNKAVMPVYSLAAIDTIIIAGAGPGNIYYMAFNDTDFTGVNTLSKIKKPFLSFAIRNSNLFVGNSDGYVLLSPNDGLNWEGGELPFLTGQGMYSLALNNSYIFAGTGSGVWRFWYPEANSITNINRIKEVPSGFTLEQNYPNPFNPVTTIKYSIPTSENPLLGGAWGGLVTLKVYNVLGREVAVLVNKQQAPGKYEVKFNGSSLASGVYIYRLQAGSFVSTKKLMLLK
jgi:hypothetical protein